MAWVLPSVTVYEEEINLLTLCAKDSKIPQKSLRERCSSSSEVTPKLAHPLGKQ